MSTPANTGKKYEILKHAIELFRIHGYDRVTINQICKAADVSKTTFYYYYPAKDALIADFYDQVNQFARENLVSILSAEDAVSQLWQICEMYIRPVAEAGHVIARELYVSNLKNDALAIAPGDILLRDAMIMLLKRARQAGQIGNPAPIEQLYDALVYLMDGISFIWTTKKGSYDLIEGSKKAFDTLLLPSARQEP
ncbi:MAG: TetR/AcrR family transcriptional regulator [Eubacteriales bacterium]|jgi:AcrR family transcriptional regulator|nr:TetR/AcrR family transcriptional regulator [Clostridiales bacterium]MDD2442079.1 TetR/AcrR family transcriptional regulator [Eubacteriales bacterium]MDD4138706.1 TetR/AcrR family transcriptional regulator [Eubacteriales bacterium]MDD4743620.1 TetR/AcrR family transcriptional regulator [Eubacteriales bacterium]